MNESQPSEGAVAPRQSQQTAKKPYQKPALRFERVFETRALTCGKISTTQFACAHSQKNS
jgi:hypothetical protein